MAEFCRCEEGAYLGAQLAGTPIRCERCRGLVDEEAKELLKEIHARALEDLERWARENPM